MKNHGKSQWGAVALLAGWFVAATPAAAQETPFFRGDANQDAFIDVGDPVTILFHLFRGDVTVPCEKAADVDDNGSVEMADAIFELVFLFRGGALPPAPFGRCGLDPTPDSLSCEQSACGEFEGSLIISEILASNDEGLVDEDGDNPDWIELHMVDSAPQETMDIGGWYLSNRADNLTQWQIPAGVMLSRGGFLVIFASGKDRAVAGEELHTSFQLDRDGEYLALVAPDGITVVDEFAPFYPEQLIDVSYGPTQSTTKLVQAGGAVRYRVPTSADAALGQDWTEPGFSTAGWGSGSSGLGFTDIVTEGFEVTFMKASITVDSLADAQNVIDNAGLRTQVVTETASVIDYFNTGERGNYTGDNAFPGQNFADINDFVVLVTGTVMIPQAGPWSFGVNSDDGFGLELRGGGQVYNMSHPSPRGPADTIQIFNIAQAGPHDLELVYYERGGGAELELFAAPGSHPSFNTSDFRLVGDVDRGGLGLLGFAADIRTDLGTAMRGVNASLWARYTFNVADPDSLGGLSLRMKYEDGFVAFLNGVEVASRNAPAALDWNASATANRAIEDVPLVEEINLTGQLALLQPGSNVLAIHGLNDTASNGDFLILPELVAASRAEERRYMSTPTPGTFNTSGSVSFVRDVEFSVEHGFFDSGFSLELSTPTTGAEIRYTLDGSTPTASSGTVYSNPLNISGTRVVRAAAFKANHIDSEVRTQSYIFVSDVKRQSPNGEPPGPGWPSGSVNGQILDYGMDPDVVNNARWSGQIEDALLSIPSISLVTDLEHFFSPSTGIYVNARNDGRAWERPTSVELIHPDGTPGFSENAGVRIRGAFSRSGDNPKHSLRIFFRKEYGPGRLDYPLFGGEGVDRFDKIDLRTSQNYSWAFQGSTKNTFMREVFSRDVQRDMYQLYTRSRYYHLYLNGHYWGLFQTQERADSDFAESYLGGRAEDYDVVKNDSSGSRALHATDGTIQAYRRLYDAAVAGFSTDSAYYRVLGLQSDGSPDPNGERLVDRHNLMDYMICTYYTGDPDAPISAWAHFSNNIFAIYDRVDPDGFKWLRHDAEHSLGANGGLNEARLLTDPTDRSIGEEWRHFNPAWLHLRLTANDEYRMEFADRVNEYFSNGGILSSGPNRERWSERARQIDLAVIGASARWGDSKTSSPRTKDHWQSESNWLMNTFFPQRTQIVINQMRSVNMFPDQAIVSFNRHGGEVAPGFQVLMTQGNGVTGTIYYTTDGSDPRLRGGSINPAAEIFSGGDTSNVTLVAAGSNWRYWDTGTDPGAGWQDLEFADDAWPQGPAQLGYGDGDEATEVSFGPDPDNKFPATYFRRVFNVNDASSIIQLTLGLVRDDGAAVYINGVEAIPRANLPAGELTHLTFAEGAGVPVGGADESTFFTYDVDPALLVDGLNVVAVEIHQADGTSSDISFDLELLAQTGEPGAGIFIDETTTLKARVRSGSNWGALTEARFTVGLEGLVINEIMASNATTLEDPAEPGEYPDWLEIYNGTAAALDLGGMYLTDDPVERTKWQFAPGTVVPSGGYLLVYVDDDGTQGPLHTSYQLSRSGETVLLVDTDGKTILDSIVFDWQEVDVSFGRYPDGGDVWDFHQSPSPGMPNQPHSR